jgi:hypothetical protein
VDEPHALVVEMLIDCFQVAGDDGVAGKGAVVSLRDHGSSFPVSRLARQTQDRD